MDFFNSLSQIAKNGKNFDKWEDEQLDEAAKRQALYKKHKYSDAEIAKAKALGERIMDVVDIMDNHSESVAENVETATQPLVATAPLTALYGSGAGIGWFIIRPALKKIDKVFNNNENLKKLYQAIDTYNRTHPDKYLYIDNINLIFSNTLKREIKDPALLEQAQSCSKELKTQIAKHLKTVKWGIGGIIAATLLTFVGINIWTTKLQVDSSKIARFQAREALKDPKNFVEYTPEQIENAKREIAANPELKNKKKKEKLKQGFFSSIWNILKDRKAYKKFKESDKDESKIVTRELTKEEIQNAKKDQEVIQRTIRLINNEAERYSQRMEVAASVIINGTPFLGMAVGGAVSWVLNKLGVIDRFVAGRVAKNGSEETKKIYETLKNGKKDRFLTMMKKWTGFTKSYINDLNNNKDKASKTFSNIIPKAKRFITAALAHPKGRGFVIAAIGGFVTGIAGAFIGLKLQKSSARAGRFTAKRELEKDPRNFIGYTQEDYEQVKDVKNNKKSKSELKNIITFLPTVLKQYFAYEKFNKNELQNKKLLKETLLKQDVSEAQLKDAKNLQRKIFNTFEKVDDKSQSYSEATEAVFDIAQPMIYYGGILAMFAPLIALGVGAAKGKVSLASIIKKVTDFFSKSSERLKSKWFKRYINNVGNNVQNVLSLAESKNKPLAKILDGVNLRENSIYDIFKKCFSNIKSQIGNFQDLPDEKQVEILKQLKNQLTSNVGKVKPELSKKIDRIFNELIYTPQEKRNEMFNILFNPSSINSMDNYDYEKAIGTIIDVLEKGFTDKDGNTKLYSIIQHNLQRLGHIKKMEENIVIPLLNETEMIIDKGKINELVELLTNIQKDGNKSDIINFFSKYKEFKETIEELKKIYVTQKAAIAENPKVKQLIETLLNHPINNLELVNLFNKFAKNDMPHNISATSLVKGSQPSAEITLKDILELLKSKKEEIKGAKIKDLSILIPEKYKDPQSAIEYFKNKINSLSEQEFAEYAEKRLRISSMDKKTMIEVLDNVKTIFENIPKDEMSALWGKIIDGFTKNPDEFMKLMANGKIGMIFVTPGLQKAVAAAGISWAAFTMGMTYIISSWLGEMQLKAGRLGVMEAMNDLKDYRYYADIEPNAKTAPQNISQKPVAPVLKIESGNLIQGYLNGKVY